MKEIRNVIVETPQFENSMSNAPFVFDVYEGGKLIGTRPKGLHGVPNATLQMTGMELMEAATAIANDWLKSEFPSFEPAPAPAPPAQ